MYIKYIKWINCLIALSSFIFPPKSPSNQSSTEVNLFHNGTPYFTETLQTTSYGTQFQNTILVEIVGIRINYLRNNSSMSVGFVRNVLKTNYSLRAGASYRDMLLASLTFRVLIGQSWREAIWSDYHLNYTAAFMTVSGPALDLANDPISATISDHIRILNEIKNTSISLSEFNSEKFFFNREQTNAIDNKTPMTAADDFYNRFITKPAFRRLDVNAFTRLQAFPYNAMGYMFANEFTLEECNECLEDFRHAPIESQIIDDTIYTPESLIDEFKRLWIAHLPDTSYKANSRNINCTTYGTEVIIPCPAGNSGDSDIILQVNLGPITKESLIAIDLAKTQFETYANAQGSPLNGTGITYRIDWAPYSGCCLALIRLNADAPTILDNNINQLGMLKIAFDQFRINFTEQEIRNNLISNWSNSLGINQASRDYYDWTHSTSWYIYNIRRWWQEVFGVESAFSELNTLRSDINNGQIPETLYADIREIIEEAFTANNSRFTYFVFTRL
ncbi:hypothetical protein [Candidatus Similichlamydia epinepheli]|uniref:hypothetical protein n=1 Tax=Candidatus Similichlamydia epinepheli TaxID=1903953 RepID=UPI00130061B3|nr:hypothetical protein [Candidatus Similichlamydia epinepheli]